MKNILNLYEGFFDDLDKLNQDDGFKGTNANIYDEHDYILSSNKNSEFFYSLYNMCKDYYPDLPSNKYGFKQEDLDQITFINSNDNCCSYFENITSLDELQYFSNLKEIKNRGFAFCNKLKSIIFPKNLKIIDIGAFRNCDSLENIEFPENIQFIEKYSFSYCTSLKEIIVPKIFKNNMKYIFSYVDLTQVHITYI